MSNSLDLDQVQLFVRPDLGPNCQQTTKPLAGKELYLIDFVTLLLIQFIGMNFSVMIKIFTKGLKVGF